MKKTKKKHKETKKEKNKKKQKARIFYLRQKTCLAPENLSFARKRIFCVSTFYP